MDHYKRIRPVYCENSAKNLLNQAGVTVWPVDIECVAKQCGAKVIYEPLDDELSGLCFIKDGVPCAVVNSGHGVYRQRFTLAHEIGHIVLHSYELTKGAHVDKTITMLRRNSESSKGSVLIEVQANRFAAALLMPEFLIRKYLREHDLRYGAEPDEDSIRRMSNDFQVSETAMAIRMSKFCN